MTPARYACILAPNFPLQALLRLRPELKSIPVVILDGESPFEQVCACSREAVMLGIELGMTKLDMEMFPSAVVLPRSYPQEAAARAALLECAGSFSPLVENSSSDSCFLCVLNIAGMETLFGSPDALGERLLKKTQTLSLETSVAITSNFHTSIAMARSMARSMSAGKRAIRVVPPGMERAALAALPLSVLDLSPGNMETFALWGITTLGELADLKLTELITRLGQQGKQLHQLARGEATHLFSAIEIGFTLEEQMELDAPVELLDSLLFLIGVMINQLIVRAQARILALASVTIRLELEGGSSYIRTVRPALPNMDRKLWLKLIHLDLQAHPPQAAILGVALHAEPGATSKVQLGLFSPQVPEAMRLDVTLARIRSIVGEDCVGYPMLKDAHRPDAFRMEPFQVPASAPLDSMPGVARVAMRQLRPAEFVMVTVRDRKPDSFVFREKRYSVERAYGPWSSGGEWWRPTLWSVEQWDLVAKAHDVADTSTRLCCCLTRDLMQERWLVEALYD